MEAFFLISMVPVMSSAQGIKREILKRLDNNNRSIQTLKADVTMVKYDSVLKVSDTTTGSTSYLPKSKATGNKMYIRVDWVTPVEEQISVIGDQYELYRPRLNQVIQGRTNTAKGSPKVGGALSFINMSKSELEANYETVYLGEEAISGGVTTWHIGLKPLRQTSYKSADLWIDGDGMPRQARVVEPNDDTTTILLSNIRKNDRVEAKIFKLNYPSSVKRIKA